MEQYMKRCFELAGKGLGFTSPNPLVGCVIVHDEKIIGEGFHRKYGEAHAEVDAIHSVLDRSLLPKSTLFVNLEPCSHFGKTPPCADLIIEKGIPNVVVCNLDPHDKVAGKGIEKLRNAGVKVVMAVLENEGKFLNRRFYTFHEKKRPYIILKWAQTMDSFMDKERTTGEQGSFQISGKAAQILNHKWRADEDAILVGSNTAMNDNPELNVRLVNGKNPLRVLIDRNLKVPGDYKVYNNTSRTLVFNQLDNKAIFNHSIIQLAWNDDVLKNILAYLHFEQISSLIVEGGQTTLQWFINQGLWDEIRQITAPFYLGKGLKSPEIKAKPSETIFLEQDRLDIYYANNYAIPNT